MKIDLSKIQEKPFRQKFQKYSFKDCTENLGCNLLEIRWMDAIWT